MGNFAAGGLSFLVACFSVGVGRGFGYSLDGCSVGWRWMDHVRLCGLNKRSVGGFILGGRPLPWAATAMHASLLVVEKMITR
jgi:hypothetical protein